MILHVTNRKGKKQCVWYYRLQIEKRTNSARDATGNKYKRQQRVCVTLKVSNRKDNKHCVWYHRLQMEKKSSSACDTTGYN